MKLAQRARPCPACARREPVLARWCGDCGAPLPATSPPTVLREGDDATPDRGPPPARRSQRRALSIAVVLLLVAAGGALAGAPVTGDPDLLGRIDETTGRSSLLPPADDVRLLWRRPVWSRIDVSGAPVAVRDVGVAALVAGEVVDTSGGATAVRWPEEAAPSHAGTILLVDGDEVVLADVRSGVVQGRSALRGAVTWRPVGHALGWVGGAAVLADVAGVLGAVDVDGTVRWVGDPAWTWDGTGDGSDWLVVTDAGGAVDRVLVVDGSDGTVHRAVGPAGSLHAPVVAGDTLVWVDPFGGQDRGLGHPVQVHGVRLDGSGRAWAVTDLPLTSGVPGAIRLTAVSDGVAVHYGTTGQSTTAVWLDPVDGARQGLVAVAGTGQTEDGWPVSTVVDDGVVHVDPVRRRVRFVERSGVVRWSVPAGAGEGVVGDGGVVLLRTPRWRTATITAGALRGSLLQVRTRLLEAATGGLRWDRVTDDIGVQRFVATMGGHVGVSGATSTVPLREQSWLELDSGRRRSGPGLAQDLLGPDGGTAQDALLLGRVQVGPSVLPVFALPDGRMLGPVTDRSGPTLGQLLEPMAAGAPSATAELADDDLAVHVGAASLTATSRSGTPRWRAEVPVVLHDGLAVLTSSLVVVVGRDGSLWALDRATGARRWAVMDRAVTALSAGGDKLVVGTGDGRVLVMDATGAVVQEVRAGRTAVGDVATIGGRVLATVGADVVGFGRGVFFVEPGDRVEVP